MGTTLTGTTPATTYDSLIKVTDNGPLSGTAKYLTDGLGNDSALALSTSAVGIGTTSGTSKANILSSTVAQTVLTLEGNYSGSGSVELLEFNRSGGAVSGAIKYQDADTAMSIGTTTSHAFIFNTGDAERMRITSTGNIGIGTDSPVYNLHINAATDSRIIITDSAQGSTANDGMYIRQSGVNSSIVNQENGTLQFGTNNSFVQTITSTGNVGIGTSSPIGKLNVFGGIGDGASYDTILTLSRISSTGNVLASKIVLDDKDTNWGLLKFKVKTTPSLGESDAYYTDALTIDNQTANVGIGTDSPTRKIQVDGGSITSDTPTMRISSTDGSGINKFGIEFYSNSGADVRGKLLADNSGRVYLDDNGGGGIILAGNGGSNVGIGVTPSAWGSGTRALQLGSYGSLNALGGVDIGIANNAYYDGSDWKYIASQEAGKYLNNRNSFIFSTAPAGSAGANVTFTDVVRIDADGLKFGSDTAAANALDDYEEGTWTMGVSFGGASTGVTYLANTGTYTKIGRQVTAVAYLALTSKGSSTGQARVTGLPFTIGNGSSFESVASTRTTSITFADVIQVSGNGNTTTLDITETTNAGTISVLTDADFANNSEMFMTITYFV